MQAFFSRRLSLPVVCAVLIVILVGNLFYLGTKPIAVNLFPEPWDKLAHAVTFGAMALLWSGVFEGRRPWLTILIVSLTGAADEIHQIWLPGRSADVTDLMADMAAAGLVVAAMRVYANFTKVQAP
ncbi:MAG TPA: VanZ family protein [Burkholderiales bacterium]|jgi:hypothetical protein